ncbi:unnamed protein product [Candidula unifasciata]|uniref:Uncharacterized protein n=1 Tax=Candidula unifasciata TaxID=100452 RepID=A0A8S3ZAM0_9EUPU|nr:unnamed protein product [Candidula unifasciata]
MAVINLKKLTREWFEKASFGRNTDVEDDGITVKGKINVPADSVRWTKISQRNDEKTFTRQVNIVNYKPQALAQISVPACDNVTRVLLEKGIVKGLEKNPTVSLPLGNTGLHEIFGNRIKIDLSLPAQEDRNCQERPSNDPVFSEQNIARGATSAVVQYKEMESEWKFVCENATLNGIAIIRNGIQRTQQQISEIIKLTDYLHDLDDIKVVNGQVRFTISGEIKFKWDCQHKVLW